MAKWGEGDPRWIVEEREDATNVNNWHWTEKNASPWSRDRLTKLFQGLVVEDEKVGRCEIKELSKIEGEATVNNRRGKLIFFYEWELKAEWEGVLTGCDVTHKGHIEIPNLSDEHPPEDVHIEVTVDTVTDDSFRLKDLMRLRGAELMRGQLALYINELKQEFSLGMILPTKEKVTTSSNSPHMSKKAFNSTPKTAINDIEAGDKNAGDKNADCEMKTKTLVDTISFECQPEHIYNALTVPDMVRAFTHGCVQSLDPREGGLFVLFDGNICGQFTEMVPNERLAMRWRLRSWPTDHYSSVTLTLSPADGATRVRLEQRGIPAAEFERTKDGWHRHYWDSIRQTFGFGGRLF